MIRGIAIYVVKIRKKGNFSKYCTVLISTPEQILIHNSVSKLERKYTNINDAYMQQSKK